MIVAPDGSIFVANNRQHNIYKFDKNGNLLKQFGRKGQGPGDFDSPGDLTILDKKYLVFGEYVSNRRITIWTMDGKCIKVVRTEKSNFYTTSLKNNRVAYLKFRQHAEKKMSIKQRPW